MKSKNKAARDCCNNRRTNVSTFSHKRDAYILAQYERGTRIAGLMICAMFALLTVGAVMFQW